MRLFLEKLPDVSQNSEEPGKVEAGPPHTYIHLVLSLLLQITNKAFNNLNGCKPNLC